MDKPLISVVICAHNAEKTLRQCIDSCLAQDRRDFEVIVVDDGSTDRTAEIARSYAPRVNVISGERRGPSRARNEGIARSSGAFIAFTDSDCIVAKDWLSRLVECFDSDDIMSAGGRQLSPADETAYGRRVQEFLAQAGFLSDYARQAKGVRLVTHNPTCNVMYRAELFKQMPGFLPGLWPGEDVEFDYRVRKRGGRIVYTSKAVVFHYRPGDQAGFMRMMERYGWAQGVLVRLHGFFRPVQYAPLALILLLCIALRFPAVIPAAALALFIYMAACRWSASSILLFFPAAFFWLAGYLKGISRPCRFSES
ncbi:MAG TPA: glycosyltransferase [Candidatus Omnitrophota bacterium]|nr:glycosyltransferase [Candidatus Omnitrophota bacterium]